MVKRVRTGKRTANTRTARLLEGLIRTEGTTLQARLFNGLRRLIAEGVLVQGSKLPSSRRLAQDLGVSRTTVLAVIEQLSADGWVQARRGAGTFVAAPPTARAPQRRGAPKDVAAQTPFAIIPGLDLFPAKVWDRLSARRWRHLPRGALQEGHGAGWSGLRASVAAHLSIRGVSCAPEQVFITNGARSAIALAARVLASVGDQVWCEEPGYFGAWNALRAQGLSPVMVPVDEEGLCVAEAEALAPAARIAVVTSHCQFPSGNALSAPRRRDLLAWAQRTGGWIIDDGYDSEFAFDGARLSSIAETGGERVVYVNSFNKILFPALRIGYLAAPESLIDAFDEAARALDAYPNVPNQMVLHDFIEGAHLDAHLRRCREVYAERRAALLSAVSEHMGPWLATTPRPGGLHLLARVQRGLDAERLVRRAGEARIDLTAMTQLMHRHRQDDRILMGFAGFSPAALQGAVIRLARVCAHLASESAAG